MEPIKVVVRTRPINKTERLRGEKTILTYDTKNRRIELRSNEREASTFRCETYIDKDATQKEAFQASGVMELVESALDGYPSTVFAYGQTGSGKTHTIFGDPDIICSRRSSGHPTDGILPRCASMIMDVVARKKEREGISVSLRVTSVEIYNDQVRDLLNSTRKEPLQVRWTKEKGFFLKDVASIECNSLNDIMKLVAETAKNRIVSSHNLNARSNRSHCLFTINIESTLKSDNNGAMNGMTSKRFGKLTIVDLAGSERVKETDVTSTSLKETGHINQSLYHLNAVISALNTKANKTGLKKIVPYRDCKLTTLLIDSLGGNSKTVMLGCISPSISSGVESLRTLEFAMGVARIKNRPVKVLNSQEKLIMRLKDQIKALQDENTVLRSGSAGLIHPPEVRNVREESNFDRLPQLKGVMQKNEAENILQQLSKDIDFSAKKPPGFDTKYEPVLLRRNKGLEKGRKAKKDNSKTLIPTRISPRSRKTESFEDNGLSLPPLSLLQTSLETELRLMEMNPSEKSPPPSPPPGYDQLFTYIPETGGIEQTVETVRSSTEDVLAAMDASRLVDMVDIGSRPASTFMPSCISTTDAVEGTENSADFLFQQLCNVMKESGEELRNSHSGHSFRSQSHKKKAKKKRPSKK